ncbi:RiPP maturation radical SAM C-methyltransferase [Corallococcus sp. AS-1-6]|uniref:RiPP maturation radical SAM C-methyltransferase n=1 Tax=Corallococcus sp. AS-1-6 TaxID=2874599 RepID=UPI001CBF9C30|nr:RiPP maturation radical SAM C-methyltransferase [Corallococcus sp. AS-1-6]MBZ4372559.1 RiPP maturation radical SAM C-methyltransferase [Corallococcus sp. AS-1-6]
MRVALIALPWSAYQRPSAALGALAAYVRQHEPGFEVATCSAFLDMAVTLGTSLYDGISLDAYELGELLYTPQMYPERREAVREYFVQSLTARAGAWRRDNVDRFPVALFGEHPTYEHIFDRILATLDGHLDTLAASLAGRYDVVALTTSFGQLFANLSLARRLKALAPEVRVVLGGSTVSAQVGPSLLKEYPFLDYVIQGEGEQPFLALLRKLEYGTGDLFGMKGLLTPRSAEHVASGAALWEVGNMDELPYPDYDEYASKAEQHGVMWLLSIEGSRGCWWDRTKRSGNPKNTCYFCNLNVQWNGYREKSNRRLVEEIDSLSERYGNTGIFFLDNIIRVKGLTELAEGIRATERDYALFYEMRANAHPYEIMRLWEAGVKFVQFGIEGLSTSYLRRVGKGTTVIQNLQAMKVCHELDIRNYANLITHFPGTEEAEVAETVQNLLSYAICYEPLDLSPYRLGRGSTLDALRAQFPVENIRNADCYKVGLPAEVYERIALFDLSFDLRTGTSDWSAVVEACEVWMRAYEMARGSQYRHVMTYLDGGTFLRVYDGRAGMPRTLLLRGVERDLYLYCTEIRQRQEIDEAFVETGRASRAQVEQVLAHWLEERILFREGERYLSVAPAFTPQMAARRMHTLHAEDQARRERRQAKRAPEDVAVAAS